MDRRQPRDPETINYWFAVTNTSGGDVANVSVIAFRRSNFVALVQHPECWDDRRKVPRCGEAGGKSTLLPASLKDGEVLTIEGQLRATDRAGKSGIGAVIGWADKGGVQHRKPIRVDPVTIENAEKRSYLRAMKTFQGIVKDLALPIALAVIAYVLKKAEDDREDQRKKAEDDREKRRKKAEDARASVRRVAEERRAQVQQTWTLMLPKMHDNSEKYYMPLMSYASNAVRYYDNDPDTFFFFYLRFFGRMKSMIDQISGFYLRYREGEEVVAVIWGTLLDLLDARVTRQARERSQLAMMQRHMTSAQFAEGVGKTPEIAALHPLFFNPAAYASMVIDVKLLSLFASVLTYEVNCSYEFWYVTEEPFPQDEWHELYAEIYAAGNAGLMPAAEFHSLFEVLDSYAASIDVRVQNMHETQVALDELQSQDVD